jgi:hypothetical protein
MTVKVYGLKPCGCGSEALVVHHGPSNKFGFQVACDSCGTASPHARLSSVARAMWNRGDRQPLPQTAVIQ